MFFAVSYLHRKTFYNNYHCILGMHYLTTSLLATACFELFFPRNAHPIPMETQKFCQTTENKQQQGKLCFVKTIFCAETSTNCEFFALLHIIVNKKYFTHANLRDVSTSLAFRTFSYATTYSLLQLG